MNTTSRKPDSVSRVKITAARGPVGSHHLHDPDRERDLEMVEPIVNSIGNGPIGEDRREAAPAGLEQVPRRREH